MTRILWEEDDVASVELPVGDRRPVGDDRRRSFLLGCLVSVAVAVAIGWLAWSGGDSGAASPDSGVSEVPDGTGSAAPAAASAAPAAAPPRVHVVIVTSGRPVESVDLFSGERREPTVPRPTRAGAAALGDEVVYISDGRAVAMSIDGDHRDLGAGTDVLPARDGWVWLGVFQQRVDRVDVIDWYEIDGVGGRGRAVPRHSPLEFVDPGLVWGFQGSVHRLTSGEEPRFRVVAYGLPVAAGLNDVIMKICTDGICVRRWYSTVDGRDGGEVLSDLAESVEVEQSGVISPDGRWIVTRTPGGMTVDLHRVRDAARVELPCTGLDRVTWSTEVAALGCVASTGVVVVDLETLALHALNVSTDASTRAVLLG